MQQGSEEWFQARLGKVTASRLSDLMATTKSGPSASRANYMAELLIERLTGERQESYQTPAMVRGNELEGEARMRYEFEADEEIEEVGFLVHPMIPMSGASPDGLVGTDGMVEIKCPNTATHIEFLRTRSIPKKYRLQMQWQMICADRQWCDFVSYDPRLPGRNAIGKDRVLRMSAADQRELEDEVVKFLNELAHMEAELRARE